MTYLIQKPITSDAIRDSWATFEARDTEPTLAEYKAIHDAGHRVVIRNWTNPPLRPVASWRADWEA